MSNSDNNTHNALDISSKEEKQSMAKGQTVNAGDPTLNASEERRDRKAADDLLNERADANSNRNVGKLELLEEHEILSNLQNYWYL